VKNDTIRNDAIKSIISPIFLFHALSLTFKKGVLSFSRSFIFRSHSIFLAAEAAAAAGGYG
jgi:hypothetical protein